MRQFRLGLLWGALLFPLVSHAVVLKIATLVPDGTSWMEAFRSGAEEVNSRTEGRVEFRFYPGGVMGNDKSVLRKIRIGQLQGGAITGGGLAEIYPDAQIYSLPFVFHSLKEVDYVRAKMDPLIIAGLKKAGFTSFGISEGGFAYLMSNQPVRSIADLKSLKVWVPEGDAISRAAFRAVDVYPISLPLTDVLTGLQTGLIDTVASSPIGAIALQWHTRVKYLTDMPLVYLYGTLVVSNRAFAKLSPQDQQIVQQVFGGVLKRLNAENRIDNAKAREALKQQGIQFVKPLPSDSGWQSVVEHTIDRLTKNNMLSASMLAILQHNLADYRRETSAGH